HGRLIICPRLVHLRRAMFPAMPSPLQSAGSRARTFALLLAGWVTVFVLLNLLGTVMAPASAPHPFDPRGVAVVAGTVWAVLTVAVGEYHRRLRARGLGLFALLLAHLPLLLIASFADGFFTQWAVRAFTSKPPVLSLSALVVLYFDFDIVAYLIVVATCEVWLV